MIVTKEEQWWLQKNLKGMAIVYFNIYFKIKNKNLTIITLTIGIKLRYMVNNKVMLKLLKNTQQQSQQLMNEINWDGRHHPSFDDWDQDDEEDDDEEDENEDEDEDGNKKDNEDEDEYEYEDGQK